MKDSLKGVGTRGRLYREFAQFYEAGRCEWAPDNPRRVFNLAFDVVYQDYHDHLDEERVLAEVYATLGFRGSDPPGLFQTFDPSKYRGKLTLAAHFLNLFARQLKGRLRRAANPRTDSGRRGDRSLFRGRGEAYDAGDVFPDVLLHLDGHERAVVHLTYWHDLSARKVGELLGIDHKTVKNVHDAAIAKLRRLYGV